MTGRKERKKKIQLRLWDSNPQPLAYMDKGTTTCAKGEPEVVGCGSGSYPVEEHCSRSYISGRGQTSTDGRVRKYSNAWVGLKPTTLYTLDRALYH